MSTRARRATPAATPDRSHAPEPAPRNPPGFGGRLWPLYVGGFLGPFGGAMVGTMLPELGHGLGTTVPVAATAVTWYMVPFAALMLVSGAVGSRLGPVRAIRLAYAVYAAASVLCALSPSALPFMAGRAVQGAANAFTTPLLIAVIAALVPAVHLGRALGTYAAAGAAGQAFAPLVGGLAASVDYRWAFGLTATAALTLALLTPAGERGVARPATRWRELANPRLGRACLTGFAGQFAATSVMLLGALIATDRFGLPPTARGLVVAGFGVAGLVSGRAIGRLVDRFGLVVMGSWGLLLTGVLALAVTGTGWLAMLVAAVAATGAIVTGVRVLTNGLALRSTPGQEASATSIALAVSFGGAAIAPALLPIHHSGAPWAAGLAPLLVCLVAMLALRREG